MLRRHGLFHPISRNKFHSYIEKIVKFLEIKISQQLPSAYALLFDVGSCADTHYLGVFSSEPSNNDFGIKRFLLTLFPLQKESSLGANENYEFITQILLLYNKSFSNVLGLKVDNLNVKMFLATKTSISLFGCVFHGFNLGGGYNSENFAYHNPSSQGHGQSPDTDILLEAEESHLSEAKNSMSNPMGFTLN